MKSHVQLLPTAADISARAIATKLIAEPDRITAESLALFARVAETDQDAWFDVRDELSAAIRALPDDRRKALTLCQQQMLEQHNAIGRPIRWVGDLLETTWYETLHERRVASGAAKVAVPDPNIQIELAATYSYDVDVAALELIAADLPSDDAAKLVTVIPERVEPAHTIQVPERHVPRQVLPGKTVSILALAKRYAGTAVAIAIEAALDRKCTSEKLTIRPIAKPTEAKTVGPSA